MPSCFNHFINLLDNKLYAHSYKVAFYSCLLAKKLNLSEAQTEKVFIGGMFHDIGKTKIPNNILYKKERLTDSEFAVIKRHCDYGVKMLKSYTEFNAYLHVVKFHHERWNGQGYKGLKGSEIPLEARIVSIADAFDAMTSERVYQKARNKQAALEEILKCSGTQFDPRLAAVFCDAVNNKTVNKQAANEFNMLLDKNISIYRKLEVVVDVLS